VVGRDKGPLLPPKTSERRYEASPLPRIAKIWPSTACAGEQREVRQALKAGSGPVILQRCCPCVVNRKSLVGLRDHKVSRSHQFMINRAKMIPSCASCDRPFETVRNPGRHERGQLHERVVASRNGPD